MNIIKYLFIGILSLSIPTICSGQEATIDFYHNKQENSIIINVGNNTENKMLVRNQGFVNEFSGSFILLTYISDGKQYNSIAPIFWDILKNGHIARFKPLDPQEKLDFSRTINSFKINNIIKVELNLNILIIDKNTEKVTDQIYKKEIDIK